MPPKGIRTPFEKQIIVTESAQGGFFLSVIEWEKQKLPRSLSAKTCQEGFNARDQAYPARRFSEAPLALSF